ncbi:hypothetical protein ES703_111183 [subsurface metagenome]
MPLYDRYEDIDKGPIKDVVQEAIKHVERYCFDIADRLKADFTISIMGKSIMFFDIRHSNPHYYIELLRESGIVNVRGYGQPTIKIIGGGD